MPEGADEAVWQRAEAFADEILQTMLASEDPADAIRAAEGQHPPDLTTLFEDLPGYANDGGLQTPYASALFSTPAGSMHPRTVRTTFGVHVLFVQEVTPGIDVSLDDATPEIRGALVIEGRAALLDDLVRRIGDERRVEVSDPGFQRAITLEIDP